MSGTNTTPGANFSHGTEKTVPTGAAETIHARTSDRIAYGVIVKALSTNTVSVYLGGSGVTTSNGLELAPGQSMTIPVTDPALIYCIAGSSSQKLRIGWV